jgi:hypothetical protein
LVSRSVTMRFTFMPTVPKSIAQTRHKRNSRAKDIFLLIK